MKQNDCSWCDKHLVDAYSSVANILDENNKLIKVLKNVQKIRDDIIDLQTKQIEVLEGIIKKQVKDSKADKQLIAFLEDKYEPSSDDEW